MTLYCILELIIVLSQSNIVWGELIASQISCEMVGDQCSLFQKHLHRRFMELIGVVWRKLRQVSSLSVDANQSFVILNGGAIKKEYRSMWCWHHLCSISALQYLKKQETWDIVVLCCRSVLWWLLRLWGGLLLWSLRTASTTNAPR